MNKLLLAIAFALTISNGFAQTTISKKQSVSAPPKFLRLAMNLIVSFDQMQAVIEENKPYTDFSRLIKGRLMNNIHSMDQTINFRKDELISKLGADDYQQLANQIKNYSEVVDKKEPLSIEQFQSSQLWLRLSATKIDEIVVKLIR
jgi:hypothetical protein